DVLRDRKLAEQVRLLVYGCDASRDRIGRGREREVFLIECDLASIGELRPGEDLDQGRLSRAVLADEGVHGPGENFEVGVPDSTHGPEALRDPGEPDPRGNVGHKIPPA